MMNPAPRHRGPSRRRFIRGLGVGLALPPLAVFSQDRSSPPKETHGRGKMLLISNNLGVLPESFFPSETGPQYQASPYLEELQLFREDLTVFSGLSHPAVAGGHSTENCFLTAAKDPTGSGFRNTISLDQFAASRLPQSTRFPTLNLGVNIDKANRSLSWTRDGILLPAEDRPSRLFEKLFVQGSVEAVDRQLHRLRQRGSILDAVAQDLRRFRTQLPREDQTDWISTPPRFANSKSGSRSRANGRRNQSPSLRRSRPSTSPTDPSSLTSSSKCSPWRCSRWRPITRES